MNTRNESLSSLSEKFEKLKLYGQALKGKELKLQQKEEELCEREIKLKLYRKHILIAIREQLAEKNISYEDQVKILKKYKEILQEIARDVQEDIEEIMG